MWESLRVRAWMVTFVVAVLAPEAGAHPALHQGAPAQALVAAPPEPVATPPIAPSPESPPSTPDSPPSTTSRPPDTPPSPDRAPASPPRGANEQPPMRRSAPLNATLPVEQRPKRAVYFVARGGVDFGGDDVFNADSTETIQAGQRYSVSGGVLYKPDFSRLALEATLGYKWQSSDGPNGTVGISRVPLEVIGSLTAGGFRFGAGIAMHFSPSFHSQDAWGKHIVDLTLDNAIGGILQLAYHIGDEQGVDLGVRGTYIQYNDKSYTYTTYDGTCFGFFIGVWL